MDCVYGTKSIDNENNIFCSILKTRIKQQKQTKKKQMTMNHIHRTVCYILDLDITVFLYLLQVISLARDHLKIVSEERTAYRTICKTTRQNLKDQFEVDGTLQLPAPGSMIPPMSTEVKMHYSFDMAQQVKLFTVTYTHTFVSNRCIIQVTLSNQDQCTSLRHANVPSSVYAVRLYHGK